LAKIWLCDDDSLFSRNIKRSLEMIGLGVELFEVGGALIDQLNTSKSKPDLILMDLNLPDGRGDEFLVDCLKIHPGAPVLMISGDGDSELIVSSMKLGAYNFIKKPFDTKKLEVAIQDALSEKPETSSGSFEFLTTETKSEKYREVLNKIKNLGGKSISVFLSGESGTGKEVIASLIHKQWALESTPFIPVNCPAIQENLAESELFGHEKGAFTGAVDQKRGALELSDSGTLFFDEVADLPSNVQSKLLRALQERKIQRLGSEKLIETEFQISADFRFKPAPFRVDQIKRIQRGFILPDCRSGNRDSASKREKRGYRSIIKEFHQPVL
jgi:DNA-binding NtrC family response regulator